MQFYFNSNSIEHSSHELNSQNPQNDLSLNIYLNFFDQFIIIIISTEINMDMDIDLSVLEDFKIQDREWINWDFEHDEYENIPLSFFNRFNKTQLKCCDLSNVKTKKEQDDYMVVMGNTKAHNKGISLNIRMGDRRKHTVASTRTFTKKQRRGLRTWNNQYKTKFKEITVKNNWQNVKTIIKRDLTENVPKIKKFEIHTLSTKGNLHTLNEKVQRVNWAPLGFKETEEYKIQKVSTMTNPELINKAAELTNSEEVPRKSVVCSLQFLLAIMTVRGGQYPWNLQIEKEGNLLMFQNYRGGDEQDNLTYLDLFTTNENSTNNMPSDENKVKDYCINATKYTKIFKDLLASGDVYKEEGQDDEEEEEQEEKIEKVQAKNSEEEEEEEEELDYKKKYVKIQMDDVDIFTTVDINGMKVRQNSAEECLIRAFVETGTDGAWVEDIKKTQGNLVFAEYLANSCSLQKWICEGIIAGVDIFKLGFIGFEKTKPKLINVTETTLKNLEQFISFKATECWPILKYIIDILYKCQNGTYVLSRSPYTPLALKLYHLPQKDEDEEQEQEQEEENKKQEQDQKEVQKSKQEEKEIKE